MGVPDLSWLVAAFLLKIVAAIVLIGGLTLLAAYLRVRYDNRKSRGFEVKPNTGETPVPLKDTNRGSLARAERNDDHG